MKIGTLDWQIEQTTTGHITQVLIRFDPRQLKGVSGLLLEIRHCHAGYLIGRFQLELLDEMRTQVLRLEAVQPGSRHLWIHCGEHCYESHIVAQSNDFIVPKLTIPATAMSQFLPSFNTEVLWRLRSEANEVVLEQKSIVLGQEATTLKCIPLRLKEPQLFAEPGDYQIVCSVADRELATFDFRIIERPEWLQGLKLQQLELQAQMLSGQMEPERGALIWEKHLAFIPRLRFAASAPAPNEKISGKAVLSHRGRVLSCRQFSVQFDQALKCIELERFSFSQLEPAEQGQHIRMELSVYIEGVYFVTWPIIIAPNERISNFEGQLHSDVDEFEVDEEAYKEILGRLQ